MEAKERSKKLKSKPQKGEHEVGKRETDKAIDNPGFEYFELPTHGVRFHIFKTPGEQLTGIILSERIQNIRRNGSFPIKLLLDCQGSCHCKAEETIEIFGTKHLGPKLNLCVGQRVRIVFLGKRHAYRGKYEKIYRVYKGSRPDNEKIIGEKKE